LHDPAGFAHALIDRKNLKKAWQADAIGYRRGHYRRSQTPAGYGLRRLP